MTTKTTAWLAENEHKRDSNDDNRACDVNKTLYKLLDAVILVVL
jgi:hypothetical protein